MRNDATSGAAVRQLAQAIGVRLPGGWCLRPRAVEHTGRRGARIDGVLRLANPAGSRTDIVVETRRAVEPRGVAALVAQLRGVARGRPALVYAPFLSPRTQQLLQAAGVSYADATGNLRLALERPPVFIETQGAEKDPNPEPRPLRSLKGPAAGRVVRALCDFRPPYGVRELAERCGAALGSVARVVGLLDREALVERSGSGRIEVVRWSDLLRRWTRDYGLMTSNQTTTLLEPRGVEALLKKLRGSRLRYCLTGSWAAARRAPLAPARLGVIHTPDLRRLVDALDLREANAGGNVVVAVPFGSIVLERTWVEDGLTFAALSQVVADLLTSPGRGPAEGEELLRWMEAHVGAWQA